MMNRNQYKCNPNTVSFPKQASVMRSSLSRVARYYVMTSYLTVNKRSFELWQGGHFCDPTRIIKYLIKYKLILHITIIFFSIMIFFSEKKVIDFEKVVNFY